MSLFKTPEGKQDTNQHDEAAFPLYAMVPGKVNALTGQQEMSAVIVPGMTLRDYFAAKALLRGASTEKCYEIADAMMEERKKRKA